MSTAMIDTTPLLTLHPDRLNQLDRALGDDNYDPAGHWLLRAAIRAEIVTWDRTRWGHPLFSLEVQGIELILRYNVTGELDLCRAATVSVLPTDDATCADLHEACDSGIEYLLMPNPTSHPIDFLYMIVDEFNALHVAASGMVVTWPGVTGTPAML